MADSDFDVAFLTVNTIVSGQGQTTIQIGRIEDETYHTWVEVTGIDLVTVTTTENGSRFGFLGMRFRCHM